MKLTKTHLTESNQNILDVFASFNTFDPDVFDMFREVE